MKIDPIIISPTQISPGSVLRIRVSFFNTKEITSIRSRTMDFLERTGDLRNIIKEDEKKITIDRISYEDPFQVTGFRSISEEAPDRKTKIKIVNKRLAPVGNAVKLLKKLKKKINTKIKTKKYSKEDLEYILKLEEDYKKIIDEGRTSIVLELPVPEDFPEGETVNIPINITYSTEKSQPEPPIIVSVTVTKNPVPKRAIIIDIDGAKRDAFYNSLPDMPNMQMIVKNGIMFTNAKTVFPSITLTAQASIFTGNYPGRHKITGNEWFDKSSETYRKYWADVWYEDIIGNEGKANEDLSVNVKTIYEAAKKDLNMDSTVIFNHYSRLNDETTRWITPGVNELYHDKIKPEYEKVDSNAINEAIEELKYHELPGIMTIYLPGLDAYSHSYGPHNQENYLKNYIDTEIGRLLNGDVVSDESGDDVIRFKGLKGEGLLDETIIIIVSDHGQARVVYDDRYAISGKELKEILKDCGYDFKNWPFIIHCDSTAALNGGMAHIYIKNIETKKWNDQPELSHLRSALDALISKTFVDRILVRYKGSGGYEVYTGEGKTQDLEAFFKEDPYYGDAVDMIRGLDSTRSGDIILLAKDSWYFAGSKFSGEHGGLSLAESCIPMIFSGPTIRKGVTDPTTARSIDMAKTLADLLGFSMPEADGRILPVKENV